MSVNSPWLSLDSAVVNAFHVCGALFAIWALVISFVGITRENFPTTDGAARGVALVSVVLCVAAIGTAIYTSATEEHGSEEEHASIPGS
jgi:heme A synthase